MDRIEDLDDHLPDGRDDAVARIDAALGRLRRSMIRRGMGRRVLDELALAIEPAIVEVVDAIDEAARSEADGVSVATVAERLVVDPSQASRLVAEAVRTGLVERLASQADGRRSLLRLTDSGTALIAATCSSAVKAGLSIRRLRSALSASRPLKESRAAATVSTAPFSSASSNRAVA